MPAIERLQLAQELLESVANEQSGLALSATQRRNPDAPSYSLAQINASLGIAKWR